MAPLSSNTLNLGFMRRDKSAPSPTVTKSKPKQPYRPDGIDPTAATLQAMDDVQGSSTGMTVGSSKDLMGPPRGLQVVKETSLLAFPMLGGSGSTSFGGPAPGRRSFGKFNKDIEALAKPLMSASIPAATTRPPPSDSGSDSSDEGSDSSLSIHDSPRKRPNPAPAAPAPAAAPAALKPGSRLANMSFMKPKGFEGPPKAKRKKTG